MDGQAKACRWLDALEYPQARRTAGDLDPPAHAGIFCVDEKSHIQAVDRLDPVLPLSPWRPAERHGFEYYRHGTLSLYAAFNTKTGEVLGRTAFRHTSAEFVAFLTDVVVNQPRGKEIHVIADNLSTHKTAQASELRYIRRYNEAPKTVKWRYFDPNRRIDTSTSAVTVH